MVVPARRAFSVSDDRAKDLLGSDNAAVGGVLVADRINGGDS
jgi:hypothetical protein